MSNEVMKNTGIKEEIAVALMHLAYHIKCDDIDLNTIADCFEMAGDFRQPQQVSNDVAVIKSAISSSPSEIQEIINVVNNVVTTTTNGTSSVENIEDLKAFLNQALPAWQNAMMNQTVFQQQFYQFPPRT